VEIQGARSITTDLDIATIGTKRMDGIDYRKVEPLQIRSDKYDDPKMLMFELFNVLRLNVL
jgi:hypothetical protein